MSISIRTLILTAFTWEAVSTLRFYPHELAYFNEAAGGPEYGYKHLLHSNLDWGQDLLIVKEWMADVQARPEEVEILSYYPYPASQSINIPAHSNSRVKWQVVSANLVMDPALPYGSRIANGEGLRLGYTSWVFEKR